AVQRSVLSTSDESQRRDEPDAVLAVEVNTRQDQNQEAAVHEAADDQAAAAMPVLGDRVGEGGVLAGRHAGAGGGRRVAGVRSAVVVAVVRLHHPPAEVLPAGGGARDIVDLLPAVLAHVGDV